MIIKRFTVYLFILFGGIIRYDAGAQVVNVQVFPEIKRQSIKSIGGNYCQANYTDHAWDAIGEATLREFRPTHVRVALPLRLRNMNFEDYRGVNFIKQPLIIELFESLRRMKNEFGVQNFTISVWNVPDELVVDPSKTAQRIIRPEAYDEVIQMLLDFFLKAKNDYGVEIDYFSFNESDGGYQVIFSPEATIAFVAKAGRKFEEAGLRTKFLWADTAQTKGTVEFATRIMSDPGIWKYIGPLSFHCWWSEKIPDTEFERIAALAKAWNRQVWCAEMGFDAMAHKVKDMNRSWDYGLRFARISHRIMKYAEVEVSLYWTWQNNYAIMSPDTLQKYPSYYVTRHLTQFLNTGTQVVHSTSSDPEILVLAGIQQDGRRVLQIINMKKEPVTAEIKGFNSPETVRYTTTETDNWEVVKNRTWSKTGTLSLQLKSQSINSFVLK